MIDFDVSPESRSSNTAKSNLGVEDMDCSSSASLLLINITNPEVISIF
jgi:hypothetical protein